jgi:hypothetical protein
MAKVSLGGRGPQPRVDSDEQELAATTEQVGNGGAMKRL